MNITQPKYLYIESMYTIGLVNMYKIEFKLIFGFEIYDTSSKNPTKYILANEVRWEGGCVMQMD